MLSYVVLNSLPTPALRRVGITVLWIYDREWKGVTGVNGQEQGSKGKTLVCREWGTIKTKVKYSAVCTTDD
jgi:hypothetical protein